MALPVPRSEGPEEQTLRLVAENARSRAGCGAAGITLLRGDDSAVVVGTSLLGGQLEQAQWEAGNGPGLDAMRQLQVFNVSCLVTTTSWPDFIPQAMSRGVRSCLAVPIILRGRALGALDLYSFEPAGFEGAERVGLHFATEAALALSSFGTATGSAVTHSAPRRAGPGRSRAVS